MLFRCCCFLLLSHVTLERTFGVDRLTDLFIYFGGNAPVECLPEISIADWLGTSPFIIAPESGLMPSIIAGYYSGVLGSAWPWKNPKRTPRHLLFQNSWDPKTLVQCFERGCGTKLNVDRGRLMYFGEKRKKKSSLEILSSLDPWLVHVHMHGNPAIEINPTELSSCYPHFLIKTAKDVVHLNFHKKFELSDMTQCAIHQSSSAMMSLISNRKLLGILQITVSDFPPVSHSCSMEQGRDGCLLND